MKRCPTCNKTKTIECFFRDSSRSDGYEGVCKDCRKVLRVGDAKIYYLKNKDRIKKRVHGYYLLNKDKILTSQKIYYENNKEKVLEVNKLWRENNKDRKALMDKLYVESNSEKVKRYKSDWDKKWRANNKGIKNANTAKRHAALMRRTPNYADLTQIKQFYTEAERLTKETGVPYHVDHIIPLQGLIVCGFHHENNLRIVTAKENMSKGNRFFPVINT